MNQQEFLYFIRSFCGEHLSNSSPVSLVLTFSFTFNTKHYLQVTAPPTEQF